MKSQGMPILMENRHIHLEVSQKQSAGETPALPRR
jgi:hypothetical protein